MDGTNLDRGVSDLGVPCGPSSFLIQFGTLQGQTLSHLHPSGRTRGQSICQVLGLSQGSLGYVSSRVPGPVEIDDSPRRDVPTGSSSVYIGLPRGKRLAPEGSCRASHIKGCLISRFVVNQS